jgi:hypothetical protein
MMSDRIPVLLTSSVIAHDTGVALTDTQERIRLTIESISQWLKIDPALQIVVCDGSSYDFTELILIHFPSAAIECLFFENNQDRVRQYGRGYGEGEIVRHALKHSAVIAKAGCFAKCTAKLWVDNFLECAADWNGRLRLKAVFLQVFSPLRKTELAYIDTRFYIASSETYARYFETAHHQISTDQGYGLEECFRDVLLHHHIKGALLTVPPVICGVGGGTGVHYRNPLKRKFKEQLRLRLVRLHRSFTDLF